MARTRLTKKERIKIRKRRRRQLIGLIFTVLVLIGIAAIIARIVDRVSILFDDTDERLEFANQIRPLVELDVANFSSIDKASQDTLLEAAIWAAIGNEDTSIYERDADDQLLVPAVDVAKWVGKMYGPEYSFQHRTVMRNDLRYEYDETRGAYVVPPTGPDNDYEPIVEKITTSGNTKILLVAYRHQNIGISGADLTPVKYKEFVMIRGSDGYYLYAIRDPEIPVDSA